MKFYYFPDSSSCHGELKKMILEAVIIGENHLNSCENFMKYYTNTNDIDSLTYESYIEAYDVVVDFCSMIDLILHFSRTIDIVELKEPETIKINRSIFITLK